MKKVNTSVNTGDIVTINGKNARVGIIRKIDGRNMIALHFETSPTSGYTDFVSVRQLNKLLSGK